MYRYISVLKCLMNFLEIYFKFFKFRIMVSEFLSKKYFIHTGHDSGPEEFYEVHPESIGRATGVPDKNHIEIFQGHRIITGNGSVADIVFGEHENSDCEGPSEGFCRSLGFFFKDVKSGKYSAFSYPHKDTVYEIIGDTPNG